MNETNEQGKDRIVKELRRKELKREGAELSLWIKWELWIVIV